MKALAGKGGVGPGALGRAGTVPVTTWPGRKVLFFSVPAPSLSMQHVPPASQHTPPMQDCEGCGRLKEKATHAGEPQHSATQSASAAAAGSGAARKSAPQRASAGGSSAGAQAAAAMAVRRCIFPSLEPL